MVKNRGVEEVERLTNGPGKLTKALSIDGDLDGEDAVKSKRLFVLGPGEPVRVEASARIGISSGREQQWRYFVGGNPFVSRREPRSHWAVPASYAVTVTVPFIPGGW